MFNIQQATPLLSEHGISQAHWKKSILSLAGATFIHPLQTSQMTRDAMQYLRKPDPSKHKKEWNISKKKGNVEQFGVDSLTISEAWPHTTSGDMVGRLGEFEGGTEEM